MDEMEELLVEVRASTDGFQRDIAAMRGAFDATLVDGFRGAGDVLERGLLGALRQGRLGFEDLRRMAFQVIDQIAARALQAGLDRLLGGGGAVGSPGGGIGGGVGQLLGGLLAGSGLPGRATGGPVAPGRGYLVGERGPEVFVPTASGRVEPGVASRPRDVRVSITLPPSRGTETPIAMARSSRQLASAVRRALAD